MGYLCFLSLCICLWGDGPVADRKGPSLVPAHNLSAGGTEWYTVTPAGALCDSAGAYRLSGCISQSPISPVGAAEAGPFFIIGGFWSSECDSRFSLSAGQVAVSSLKPRAFTLHRNTPNPFRQATRISYDLPARGRTSLVIYDVDGRQVRMLADGWQDAGRYSLDWDGKDKKGRACPAGIYFCALKAGGRGAVEKMLIAR